MQYKYTGKANQFFRFIKCKSAPPKPVYKKIGTAKTSCSCSKVQVRTKKGWVSVYRGRTKSKLPVKPIKIFAGQKLMLQWSCSGSKKVVYVPYGTKYVTVKYSGNKVYWTFYKKS